MKKAVKHLLTLKNAVFIILLFCFFVISFILYKSYVAHASTFGCFDDCFNYMGGYFLLRGRQLYSQIFFNHQPFMAYISFFIQNLTHSDNLYGFISIHRKFIIVFSFFFDLFLIARFRWAGVLFALLFEPIKYYVFGNHFLAESIVVYLVIYLFGLFLLKHGKKKIFLWDYYLAALFTWAVIFLREPYIPLALLLFTGILWGKMSLRKQGGPILAFIFLTFTTLLLLPFPEYLFNVYTVNKSVEITPDQFSFLNLLKIFGYPVFIFFSGKNTFFRLELFLIALSFFSSLAIYILRTKKIKLLVTIIVILGVANLRIISPGTMYYEAFHLIVWLGTFVFITAYLTWENISAEQNILKKLVAPGLLIISLFLSIFSPSSFIKDRVDAQNEFTTNFANDYAFGSTIKALSTSHTTLFLDGADDLIYWQAGLLSPYRYTWYTSVMPHFKKYVAAREDMFKTTPPDFYYGNCNKAPFTNKQLPIYLKEKYVNFTFSGNPTCLYVKQELVKTFTPIMLEKIKPYGLALSVNMPSENSR